MIDHNASRLSLSGLNTKALNRYAVAVAVLYVIIILYALLGPGWRYALPLVLLPVVVGMVASPRLALYQFVFACFIDLPLVPSIPLNLVDLSMLAVIAAAALDLLSGDRVPERLPRLSLNYLYLIGALVLCGLFGFWPELATRRVVSTVLLLLTFLSIHRLSGKVAVGPLVRFYFWLAVVHSIWVLVPYLAAGGAYRSFGFAVSFYDDFAMIALPLGVGFYLGSRRGIGRYYLAGCMLVFGGLVATQVRAAIIFAAVASTFVMWAAYRQTRAGNTDSFAAAIVGRRTRTLIWLPLAAIAVTLMVNADLLTGVLERFGELFSAKPTGTTVYRLALWKRALLAFTDHPFMGVGPGGFYHLHDLYDTLHITPDYNYLRGLGAHNPLLHYLAEQGLVGGLGLLALIANHFRLARRSWYAATHLDSIALALYGWAFLFAFTMVLEAGWMWGPASFPAVLMVALTVRYQADNTVPGPVTNTQTG